MGKTRVTNVTSPKAPELIAINKKTGKLVWEDNSVSDRILHGQWSAPAVGKSEALIRLCWLRVMVGFEAMKR